MSALNSHYYECYIEAGVAYLIYFKLEEKIQDIQNPHHQRYHDAGCMTFSLA